MAEFAKMIENDYSIKRKGTTVQNTQATAILECVHQTIENIIRKFSKENMDEENPLAGILAAMMFEISATSPHHTASYQCSLSLNVIPF
jgi:hypothetical protein